MELPRHADDDVPETRAGALLSLADRLDLMAGLFAIGAAPTGSSDPFALRRAALGLVNVLRAHPGLVALTISGGLDVAAANQPVPVTAEVCREAADFAVRRFERQLLDIGYPHALVQAVLPIADTPALAMATLDELTKLGNDPAFASLAEAIQRVSRIVPPGTQSEYDASLLQEPAEVSLHEAATKVRAEWRNGPLTLARFAVVAQPLVRRINAFFDEVLVMTEDPAVRAARLGLLASIQMMASRLLDWSQL
jgi:glycyl-tRNA synthetase